MILRLRRSDTTRTRIIAALLLIAVWCLLTLAEWPA